MKWLKPRFVIVLLLTLLTTSIAWAHRDGSRFGHRGVHVGLVFALPLTGFWHYRSPYLHNAPSITTPSIYIERSMAEQPSSHWWYYCPDKQAYYPYVKDCPEAWQLVAPQPYDLR